MQTVFHNSDPSENDHVLANVENLLDDDTVEVDDVAVVLNGDAVRLLTVESDAGERIESLQEADVEFFACRNSLRGRDLSASEVRDGVEVVPSGVGRLTELQSEGYAYITP